MSGFVYHIVWNDRVVDRAMSLPVAERVCADRESLLGRPFKRRPLQIVSVPSGRVVSRYRPGLGFLRLEEAG